MSLFIFLPFTSLPALFLALFIKASYNIVKRPPVEKVVKERQRSLSSLAIICGGYPHLFMLPA
jgi:magnesium-transporting ATPase (P-type)